MIRTERRIMAQQVRRVLDHRQQTFQSLGDTTILPNEAHLMPTTAYGTVVPAALETLYAFPLPLGKLDVFIANLLFETTVAAAAGGLADIAIYDSAGVSGYPSRLICAGGSYTTDGVIGIKGGAPSVFGRFDGNNPLGHGELWWIALVFHTALPTIRAVDAGAIMGGNGGAALNTKTVGIQVASAGFPPNVFPAGGTVYLGPQTFALGAWLEPFFVGQF